ncbi:MAG TPA: bifunctional phosphoribosylaminoimidazolecarboxamide formyltransferase/IMP cyclohydrolase, partial [Gaiellaceae bacterium]|nr:bifunctional phosphoribosylaminoimidazolecarboxamide formyltransferase/IMP cyclohydrolase [Gaiellaceae bacterium]
MIRRALLSVYDKRRLEPFARALEELGVELVASGGTAAFLEKNGIAVTPVEDLTEVPELLGGRVKTLHPRIHAAILARRDRADDSSQLDEHGIEPFDLVCVNLYPFEEVVSRRAVGEQDAVEMIDIGGPAMLRAAAKNFAHVAPVCRPERYDQVLDELRERRDLLLETRRRLAAETFAVTAAYEAAIAKWFTDPEAFPQVLLPAFDKELELAYGENPHQRAAYYSERGARRHLLSRVEQLHGRELSFNNLNDLSAARLVAREFELPACVIVKHANPCGVAVAGSIEQAY